MYESNSLCSQSSTFISSRNTIPFTG